MEERGAGQGNMKEGGGMKGEEKIVFA